MVDRSLPRWKCWRYVPDSRFLPSRLYPDLVRACKKHGLFNLQLVALVRALYPQIAGSGSRQL